MDKTNDPVDYKSQSEQFRKETQTKPVIKSPDAPHIQDDVVDYQAASDQWKEYLRGRDMLTDDREE